jgi:hypothetical protein
MPFPVTDAEAEGLNNLLKGDLINKSKIHTAGVFPECADFLMSIVKLPGDPGFIKGVHDQFLSFNLFNDYFVREPHIAEQLLSEADRAQYSAAFGPCIEFQVPVKKSARGRTEDKPIDLPKNCCIPCCCVTLGGVRRVSNYDSSGPQLPAGITSSKPRTPTTADPLTYFRALAPFRLEDLFFGDVLTVFYLDYMGIFEIIDAMIKDYFDYGQKPVPIGSLSSIVLETMGRLIKKGLSPSRIDLEGLYVRMLGWKHPSRPRQLNEAVINFGFNTLFHKLIVQMLHLLAQEQVIDAVTAARAVPPIASEVALMDTLALLNETRRAFRFNINRYTTLNCLVWLTAGLAVLEQNRDAYGIPESSTNPPQYIENAYSVWVRKEPLMTPSHTNRFLSFASLYESARSILLDLEVLDITNPKNVRVFAFLKAPALKAYSDAFKIVTGIDLGAIEYRTEGTLRVPQQA